MLKNCCQKLVYLESIVGKSERNRATDNIKKRYKNSVHLNHILMLKAITAQSHSFCIREVISTKRLQRPETTRYILIQFSVLK